MASLSKQKTPQQVYGSSGNNTLPRMPTQLKTKLLFLSAFLVILIMSGGLIYVGITNYSYNDFYRLLSLRAAIAAQTTLDGEHVDRETYNMTFDEDYFERFPNEKDYFFPIDQTDFQVAAKDVGVPHNFFETLLAEGEADYSSREIFYKGIRYDAHDGPYAVVVTAENYYDTHHTSYLRRIMFLSSGVAFLFALLISFYLSKRLFRPLNEITKRVNEISTENLYMRLPHTPRNDELGSLVSTFNNMLDRIETSFETQNNFISNASHELRTPLTAIIGEGDVALSKERDPSEYIETIQIMLEEAEKLEKKTKALLFLAQTGFYDKAQKFDKVRMDQLLWDVKETLEKINPGCQLQIDLSLLPENPALLKVFGNDQLLHLALSNIINNACKYSNNQPVYLSVGSQDNRVIAIIRDKGIGIPADEMKNIYDPFFRASNTSQYEGFGIGLPLTRNIVRMHQGEILVSSIVKQGTTVQISLPVYKIADEPTVKP